MGDAGMVRRHSPSCVDSSGRRLAHVELAKAAGPIVFWVRDARVRDYDLSVRVQRHSCDVRQSGLKVVVFESRGLFVLRPQLDRHAASAFDVLHLRNGSVLGPDADSPVSNTIHRLDSTVAVYSGPVQAEPPAGAT